MLLWLCSLLAEPDGFAALIMLPNEYFRLPGTSDGIRWYAELQTFSGVQRITVSAKRQSESFRFFLPIMLEILED